MAQVTLCLARALVMPHTGASWGAIRPKASPSVVTEGQQWLVTMNQSGVSL